MLRIITLNLNGIRSAWRKGLLPWATAQVEHGLASQTADTLFECVKHGVVDVLPFACAVDSGMVPRNGIPASFGSMEPSVKEIEHEYYQSK